MDSVLWTAFIWKIISFCLYTHLKVATKITTYSHQNPMINSKTGKYVGSLDGLPEETTSLKTTHSDL